MYTGDFKHGKLNGQGKYLDKAQALRYEGQFRDDLFHGEGVRLLTLKDRIAFHGQHAKEKYAGQWRQGRRYGKGVWSCGKELFEGQWKDDRIDGVGLYRWENGDTFEGELKNQLRDGQGCLYTGDGDTYEHERIERMTECV